MELVFITQHPSPGKDQLSSRGFSIPSAGGASFSRVFLASGTPASVGSVRAVFRSEAALVSVSGASASSVWQPGCLNDASRARLQPDQVTPGTSRAWLPAWCPIQSQQVDRVKHRRGRGCSSFPGCLVWMAHWSPQLQSRPPVPAPPKFQTLREPNVSTTFLTLFPVGFILGWRSPAGAGNCVPVQL